MESSDSVAVFASSIFETVEVLQSNLALTETKDSSSCTTFLSRSVTTAVLESRDLLASSNYSFINELN